MGKMGKIEYVDGKYFYIMSNGVAYEITPEDAEYYREQEQEQENEEF